MSADESGVPEGAAVFPLIPAELGVNPLVLAVVHVAVFLSGSEDDIIHPDAAEEALQYLAGYLQRLEGPALHKVREDMDCLATFGRQEKWPKQVVRFLRDFLADCGVGGDEA
jgi:hypothetical protein